MSTSSPAYPIPRWSVVGMEGMFTKMWDPPTESPATPDLLVPTNPVPEIMAAAGYALPPVAPHTMQFELLHGMTQLTWDGLKSLTFFTLISPDIPATANGQYPAVTHRLPVGVVFHGKTQGKGPPPHTIHWHGIEPTPMNDGVGHCSMELGKYTYQWQPTFVGTYFYHCHRNTMQHFEFGLFGLMIFEPADAYFATLVDPNIPIGHCRDGKRRTGANLQNFPQFPGWEGGDRTDPDPWTGDPAMKMQNLNPQLGNINPHAQTVPYDVEAIWVFDDRDSNWSDLAQSATTAFPQHGPHPGYDDNFARNPGTNGFLAFNDFGADYWFVTGVPVPAHKFGTGTLPEGIVIPPEINSGISGSQISVEAFTDQTVLFRLLDAAYNNCTYKFPFDIVILEWDGRPLGVPPFGYNEAYLVPAGTPIEVAVGRRFGALARFSTGVNTTVEGKFIDTRGATIPGQEQILCTVNIPVNIHKLTLTHNGSNVVAQGTPVIFTAGVSNLKTVAYEYELWLFDGTTWTLQSGYSAVNQFTVPATAAAGTYTAAVNCRRTGTTLQSAVTYTPFQISGGPATGVVITPDQASPHTTGTAVVFTAAGQGSGGYDYRFWLFNGATWSMVQNYGNGAAWSLPAATPAGKYLVAADVRCSSTVDRDTVSYLSYEITTGAATGVVITPDQSSPHPAGTAVVFTAAGQGSSGYDYRFWLFDGTSWAQVQDYGNGAAWTLPAATLAGSYVVAVDVRTSASVNRDTVAYLSYQVS